MKALSGDKSPGLIAKQHGVHPVTVEIWKKAFMECGPELFSEDDKVKEFECRITELEQLLGKKEVEIVLLKNFFGQNG